MSPRLARIEMRLFDRARPQRRRHVQEVLLGERLRRGDRRRQRRALSGGAGLEVGRPQVRRRVAQRRRPHRGLLRVEHRGQPLRRQPEQERELLLDRIVAADHPVLEDAPVELVDDLARVRPRAPVDEQRRRLAQRRRAGRIAAQIVDHARADQLDGHGDLLELVLAQQLAHHAAREQAVLAQRAADLGQAIGRRACGRRRRVLRAASGAFPCWLLRGRAARRARA